MDEICSVLEAAVGDRYRIRGVIGSGGMATVVLAEDRKHEDRRVAIKVLRWGAPSPQRLERFRREIGIVGSLQHPHILPLFDSGIADELPFFVMPYVEGSTLRDRLRQEGGLPLEEAVQAVIEIAEALEYAHARDIVHGDVKPANILISSGKAMVFDFGIARGPRAQEGPDQGSGVAVGSAPYMSPEQVRGEAFDGRSDVYSLGCVLFELLVGRPPYGGRDARGTAALHLTAARPSARAMRPSVPADLDRVVRRALAKRPSERYASAKMLRDDLERVRRRMRRRLAPLLGVATVAAVAAFALTAVLLDPLESTEAVPVSNDASVLVLPFQEVGDPYDSLFSAALADAISGRLQRSGHFRVMGQVTARRYAGQRADPDRIRRDLGIDYLLTGTVRWDRGTDRPRVRVTPELVRLADGASVWSQSYDESRGSILDLEADIAGRVATELGSPAALVNSSVGTESPEAWMAFLRGVGYQRSGATFREELDLAIEQFETAVQLDPEFVDAHWALARAYGFSVFNWLDYAHHAENALAAVRAAQAVAPGDPGTLLAEGWYNYYVTRDYAVAARLFEEAERGSPGRLELRKALGFVQRRLGRWDEAIQTLEGAFRSDPGDYLLAQALGRTYLRLRRYEPAEEYLDQAIALGSDVPSAYLRKLTLLLVAGRSDQEIADFIVHADGMLPPGWALSGSGPGTLVRLSMLSERYPDLFARGSARRQGTTVDEYYGLLAEGIRAERGGLDELASLKFDSARVGLSEVVDGAPQDYAAEILLGLAAALAGDEATALAHARSVAERESPERDAMQTEALEALARVHTILGQTPEARAVIARLSAIPSLTTPSVLQNDPMWSSMGTEAYLAASRDGGL